MELYSYISSYVILAKKKDSGSESTVVKYPVQIPASGCRPKYVLLTKFRLDFALKYVCNVQMLSEGPYNVYYWRDMYLNHHFFAWYVSIHNILTEPPSLSESTQTSTIVSKAISSTLYFLLTKILFPNLPLKHSESLCFHYFFYFPSYLSSCCITNFSNSNLSWLKVVSVTQLSTAHVVRYILCSYKLFLVHFLNYGLKLCKSQYNSKQKWHHVNKIPGFSLLKLVVYIATTVS